MRNWQLARATSVTTSATGHEGNRDDDLCDSNEPDAGLSPGLGLIVVAAVGRTAVVGNSGNDRTRSGREIKLMPKTAFRRSVLAQLNGFHRLGGSPPPEWDQM